MAAKYRRYSHDFESRLPSLSCHNDSANNEIIHLFRSVSIILAMSGLVFGQNLDWENYDPPSTLVVPETPIVEPISFMMCIAIMRMGPSNLADRVVEMDAMNMGIMVNLSRRGGSQLKAMASNVAKATKSLRDFHQSKFQWSQ